MRDHSPRSINQEDVSLFSDLRGGHFVTQYLKSHGGPKRTDHVSSVVIDRIGSAKSRGIRKPADYAVVEREFLAPKHNVLEIGPIANIHDFTRFHYSFSGRIGEKECFEESPTLPYSLDEPRAKAGRIERLDHISIR